MMRRRIRRRLKRSSPSENGKTICGDAIQSHGPQESLSGTVVLANVPLNTLVRDRSQSSSGCSVCVIVETSSADSEFCKDSSSLDGSTASISPQSTVASLSDSYDDDLSPETSLFESSEDESCGVAAPTVEDKVGLHEAYKTALDKNHLQSAATCVNPSLETESTKESQCSFTTFRINYLLVMLAIMLADGLQGTHLYVLYEGYGYSVASLYCLGFLTGAVFSPITGPLVDRFGRKKSALAYCILEIAINQLEQYPYLPGLIVSRMVGGITTNLLCTVFETWLDTEYRRRGFKKGDYEILMRDSMVVSNLAAIGSGYLAHLLADHLGPKGPFKGAVTCTCIALGVVMMVWSENYGSEEPGSKSAVGYLRDAYGTFKSDSRVLRVGLIHGLTTGAIQIFIFLWSPSLRAFAKNAPLNTIGTDKDGEPAYGLIFGAFMACGVLGGLAAPRLRKAVTVLLSPLSNLKGDEVEVEGEGEVRPMAVEFLAASCYFVCALLLLTPCIVPSDGSSSFSRCLVAFLTYELLIGIYLPTAGVIRSIYLPSDSRCSLLTMPQVIVNVAVSMGVVSTNFVSLQTAFAAVSFLMMTAGVLQLTLVSAKEWSSFFGRVDHVKRSVRRLSSTTCDSIRMSFDQQCEKFQRSQSCPVTFADRPETRLLSNDSVDVSS